VNGYEGLNLPQLLDRMHPLASPEPVSWLPGTDGWWAVLVWALLLAVTWGFKVAEYRRLNRYRREALAELTAIIAARGETDAADISRLIKRTALTVYPRIEVASLYGDAWADFLVKTGQKDPVISATAADIAKAAYRPGVEVSKIAAGAERWIRRHHV
jgi:hypothetical protein